MQRRKFYHKHKKFVIRQNVETKKVRVARERAARAVSDAELDRRALERWNPEWGPPNLALQSLESGRAQKTSPQAQERRLSL